jgi:hypothetical protein
MLGLTMGGREGVGGLTRIDRSRDAARRKRDARQNIAAPSRTRPCLLV